MNTQCPHRWITLCATTVLALGAGGCSSLSSNQQATALGAVVGGVVGSQIERRGR